MWSLMGQNSQHLIVAEVFKRDTAYNSQLVLLRSVLVRFTARFFSSLQCSLSHQELFGSVGQ